MPSEIELKILGIDKKEVVSRLKKLNAKKLAKYNFRQILFPIKKNSSFESWCRLRTDGKSTVFTLKEQSGKGISNTQEYEMKMLNFENAAIIFCKIFAISLYIENEREEYSFNKTLVTVDKWPGIPYVTEIEGPSEKSVNETYKLLAIKGNSVGNVSPSKVYAYYGLNYEKIGKKNFRKFLNAISSRRHNEVRLGL